MERRRVVETHLGEGDVVCDNCNRLAKRDEVCEIRDPTSPLVLHQHKNGCIRGGDGEK